MPETAVGILTKYPTPGKVKTRLAKAIGPELAVKLHSYLTYHTLHTVGVLVESGIADCTVFYDGSKEDKARAWLLAGMCDKSSWFPRLIPQVHGDLGERMTAACKTLFSEGYGKVILLGTDCPGLDVQVLKQAIIVLHDRDVVFGPAFDGGYYLIGVNRFEKGVFEGIGWSKNTTLEESIERCKALGLGYALLKRLPDIDMPQDLEYLHPHGRIETECDYPHLQRRKRDHNLPQISNGRKTF